MKQSLLLFLAILLLNLHLTAQNKTSISGNVKDLNGKVISAATILLQKSSDSSIVKTDVTDNKGNFSFEGIKPADYFISITFVGHQKFISQSITVKEGENFALPASTLQVADKNLQGVTVTSKKPIIEVKADKTIFNVENSINATGSNAFELLQKSPGVVTDKDDNISLKGKNGVRVYIDGRLTQLNSSDLAAYLKSINSVDIEAIEMITNPSAKYDAQGNAGIINIKLKKNKKYGLNGSASAGLNVGINPKTNSALSLNYRNKKSNWFSNYSNNWAKNESDFFLYREQLDSIYDQTSKMFSEGWSHNVKAGADFFLNKKQTIGFIATINTNNSDNSTNSRTPISSIADGKTSQILYASNFIPGHSTNANFNANYSFSDTAGHELNVDADYGMYKNRRSSYQPNSYYTKSPETLLYEKNYRNNTPTDINIISTKIDYTTNFKKGKLGLGAKFSYVKTDNTFSFFNVINNYDLIDSARSNSFTYKENVNAAYVNYNKPINFKWAIQAGVRVENTRSDGTLTRVDGIKQSDDRVKRDYTNLFPSAAITFTQSMNHIFNLTYSRRIDRPNYQDLNPFENKLDELTYQKGNAFLRPQYTNSIELTHTYKYRFNTTIGYSHISDYRAQVIDTAEKTKSYITQRNLASQDIYNINFSLPFQITKWWSLYTNINAFHSYYKADFGEGKKINISVNSASVYMQQSFIIGGGYTGEISGFYSAPSVWGGTFKSRAIGNLDIGIQKQLFKGKGTFKVSYTDLLRTLRWRGVSDFGAAYIDVRGNWESQQLRMNFTYRFGNNQVKAARQRKTATEEESKRTQSSGGIGGN